jgi:hypothetical protein
MLVLDRLASPASGLTEFAPLSCVSFLSNLGSSGSKGAMAMHEFAIDLARFFFGFADALRDCVCLITLTRW